MNPAAGWWIVVAVCGLSSVALFTGRIAVFPDAPAPVTLLGSEVAPPFRQLNSEPREPELPMEPLGNLTFTRDVAPIIFRSCSVCHRPGEAAPFSLLTYEDVCRHAAQIDVMIQRRLMPPWKAVGDFGQYSNDRRLQEKEIVILRQWIAADLVRGREDDLPPAPVFTPGWQLGEPDLELTLSEPFDVPADGPDIYQHFVIPTGLTENRLVSAFEFRPGATEAVHHSILYFDSSGRGRELDSEDPGPGYRRLGSPGFEVGGSLGGWSPGGSPHGLPSGFGRPLEKSSDLVVQIHYHPSGRPVSDQSRIGLYFAPPESTHLVTELMVANVDLRIPAGAKRHRHQAELLLPVDTILFDATPHMHQLGREIRAVAILPDGTERLLIHIPDWDFYWQDSYTFSEPLELPQGTRIELDCWFDNSDSNQLNPSSPPRTVTWGDFSSDEMAICYFQATTREWNDYVRLHSSAKQYFAELWEQYQKRIATRKLAP